MGCPVPKFLLQSPMLPEFLTEHWYNPLGASFPAEGFEVGNTTGLLPPCIAHKGDVIISPRQVKDETVWK